MKTKMCQRKSEKSRESMLAYWTPEIGSQLARVSLQGFPSRTILRSKDLFNVSASILG